MEDVMLLAVILDKFIVDLKKYMLILLDWTRRNGAISRVLVVTGFLVLGRRIMFNRAEVLVRGLGVVLAKNCL